MSSPTGPYLQTRGGADHYDLSLINESDDPAVNIQAYARLWYRRFSYLQNANTIALNLSALQRIGRLDAEEHGQAIAAERAANTHDKGPI